ncbi:SCO family protein [Rapidithrix thailandica]|uniref:SCO family protein n=1 Tax=Rapidithrix thailandica TaxID=413964 RepID=A0AAW9S9X2_9BACT
MKKSLQAGTLIIILVVPAFIFIGLHLFGENKFDLPVYDGNQPEDKELMVFNPKSANCPDVAGEQHHIPEFQLLNQDSSQFLAAEALKGKVYVANFFFARCLGICINMTSELLRVQDKFKDHPDVRLVSFTVDPKNDRPKELKDYAEQYRIESPFWTLLTGEKQEIYDLAHCGFYLVAKPAEEDPNDFIHSDKLVLVDKEGRIRGYYSGTDREEVDRLIQEILVLLQTYE